MDGARKRRPTHGRKAATQMERWRDGVYLRDGYTCVAKGTGGFGCSTGLSLQHRQSRGMGGGSRADGPEHFVTLCLAHNSLAEQSAPFRALCERNGWSVPRWQDPRRLVSVPVKYPDGSWWLLDGWGDRQPIPDPEPYWAVLRGDE